MQVGSTRTAEARVDKGVDTKIEMATRLNVTDRNGVRSNIPSNVLFGFFIPAPESWFPRLDLRQWYHSSRQVRGPNPRADARETATGRARSAGLSIWPRAKSVRSKSEIASDCRFGEPRTIVDEPLSWALELPIQWRAPKVDLAELARLRWIEKWTRKDLAERFQRTEIGIQFYFQKFKRDDFRIPGLSRTDRKRIREITSR
jgi:hypothetical protein